MRWAERERVDQPREAVRVIRETEIPGHIGGPARPRFIPGDNREFVCQSVELWLPDAAVLTDAVHEHERRSLASSLIRDIKARDSDDVHGVETYKCENLRATQNSNADGKEPARGRDGYK